MSLGAWGNSEGLASFRLDDSGRRRGMVGQSALTSRREGKQRSGCAIKYGVNWSAKGV